jgi:5'-nucleotidase
MAMKILLTNDDGIDAPGLKILLEFAKKLGDVTIMAPLVEQSGKSQGIELHKSYQVKERDFPGADKAYSIDSTPADGVRSAVLGLSEKYDLVISGVNRGFNVGADIAYSGTVGAVYEASRQGIKAIAISTDYTGFEGTAHIGEVYDFIVKNNMLSDADILNVNIPQEVTGGIRVTKQGYPMYEDDFEFIGDDHYIPKLKCVYADAKDFDIDTDCVMNGYISITPLHRDNTDMTAYEKLKKLNIR